MLQNIRGDKILLSESGSSYRKFLENSNLLLTVNCVKVHSLLSSNLTQLLLNELLEININFCTDLI